MDYPNSIFTLLGDTYDLKVHEPITSLCPSDLCAREKGLLGRRMTSLLADLKAVYLHILLPLDLADGLPVVTETWKDFTSGDTAQVHGGGDGIPSRLEAGTRHAISNELKKDRGALFRRFVESIHETEGPTLYVYHCYLPHAPWIYLPSGKRHNLKPVNRGLVDKKWSDNHRYAAEAFKGHLLQLGFVDRLLGEFLDRLKTTGLYHNSLIIVTADHGISFRPGDESRHVTQTNYMDILPIPLFIKLPGQQIGMVDDRNVELIDILPTISDILDISLPFRVDGRSMFDKTKPERGGKKSSIQFSDRVLND